MALAAAVGRENWGLPGVVQNKKKKPKPGNTKKYAKILNPPISGWAPKMRTKIPKLLVFFRIFWGPSRDENMLKTAEKVQFLASKKARPILVVLFFPRFSPFFLPQNG